MAVSLFLYALVVLGLLIAELREDRRAQFFFKPLAAFGFVVLALQFGALATSYGQIILVALVMCALGDILLFPRTSKPLFLFGMIAFAFGHIFLIMSFLVTHDLSWKGLAIGSPLILCLGIFCLHHLRPKIPDEFQTSVDGYSFVVVMMVAVSFAYMSHIPMVVLGALMFATSDMFVARDRFVKPSPKNALAITPLYFGAQALFALSTSI